MPEREKVAQPSTPHPASKPAVGAILTGALMALVGYFAAIAQAMNTAPSHALANAAVVVMILGCALALCGIASIWVPRLRRPARAGNYVALALLALAIIADKVLIDLE
jgi:hypothetical protein